MRSLLRKIRLELATLALALTLPLALCAWLPWHGGLAAALNFITASYTSPAAASYQSVDCINLVTATVPAGAGNTLTGINSPVPIPVGSMVSDGAEGNGTYILYATTVVAESGPQTNLTLTLSSSIINAPASPQSDLVTITAPPAVAQWDWDPSKTYQQAAAATSGTPQIVQFRNSAEGTPAAAQFTAAIVGTTLSVSAVSSGTIAVDTPLYDAAGHIAQGTYILSQIDSTHYTVSAAQSVASEAMQTMGQVATYGSFNAAFPYNSGATYLAGDVFLVMPAVYLNDTPILESQLVWSCYQNVTVAVGATYVEVPGSNCTSGLPAVGEYVKDGSNVIWPSYLNVQVAAVDPAGCTAPCFEVSVPAVNAGSAFSLDVYQPLAGISVEGVTVSGVRPVIDWNSGGGILVGANGNPGIYNDFLWNNIDLHVDPGTVNLGVELISLVGPSFGFTTFENMRLGPGLNGGGSNCLHSGDDYGGADISGTLNLLNIICYDSGGYNSQEEHGFYIGDSPNLTFNLVNSWVHGISIGHEVKSRAAVTNLVGDYLEGGPPPNYGVHFTGAISGNVLTVTGLNSASTGAIEAGNPSLGSGMYYPLSGAGVRPGTYIDMQATDTDPGGQGGYDGNYLLSQSQSVASESMASGQSQGEQTAVDASCGGALTMTNTILSKALSGPDTAGDLFEYGEEHTAAVLTIATAVNSGTLLTFTTAVPSDVDMTHLYDLDTPLGLAPDTAGSSFSGDTITVNQAIPGYPGIKAGDRIVVAHNCLQDAANSIDIHNDTFVSLYPTFDGANWTAPMWFFQPTVDGSTAPQLLPGDAGWAISSWSVKNNEFVGFCHALSGGASPSGEYFDSFPWYGTQPSGTGIQVVQALTELSQSFSPTVKYAPSGDSSNVGAVAYEHQAISGLVRALATIGAVD